jgi:ribosomal-protein-alanine N-acetyltransferase
VSERGAVIVRPATRDDLPALARIEAESLTGTWTLEALADELQKSFARLRVASLADGEVVAFAHGWLVADEVQVLNVATDARARRKGVARTLLEAWFAEARAAGFTCALLEVRASNAPAIALYRGLGFSEDAVRRRYYSDGEDALLMSVRW